MKIGISLNEVLRDFLGQFLYTYEKYFQKTGLDETDLTDLDFTKINAIHFSNKKEFYKFLYQEAPLEIFGHADTMADNLINQLNMFLEDMKDEGHEVQIVSKEIDKSIPSTFFFLSKLGAKTNNVIFVNDGSKEWLDNDILITANPEALANKPNGKISIKIKSPYNNQYSGDFELNGIIDFFKDNNLKEKVFNTKITSYEEI